MTWSTLIPTSLLCAITASGVVTISTPAAAVAETAGCGQHKGKLCDTYCARQCTDGSCCDEYYSYWTET